MSIFESERKIKIPSELLSPNVTNCIGDWLEMVANGKINPTQLKERIKGLWWLASKSQAIHCEMVINNFDTLIYGKTDEEIITQCKTTFRELLK
jgi:hypothetical protein